MQNISFAECQLAVPSSNKHRRVPIVSSALYVVSHRVHSFSASDLSNYKLVEEEFKIKEPTAATRSFSMAVAARFNPKLFPAEDSEIDSDDSSSYESILFTDSEDEDDFVATPYDTINTECA